MKYKAIRGMEDILPEDIGNWQWIEKTAREILESYGYAEIRTPILEDASIFTRSIGEETDIVTKEMYAFKDKKERKLALRPEGTAPIVRAYVEHSLDNMPFGNKLYYIGPMFRSERPQKGRQRQFHQIGVEAFGSNSPHADAEVIMQLDNMLKSLGLRNYTIDLNSLGCRKDKIKFADELKSYLKDKQNRLCDDCKVRVKKNILRVLDCKKDVCIQVLKNAPNVLSSLCDSCKNSYEKLKACLSSLGIDFKEKKNLVRGLDYYTGTVFEITHASLGSQDAIGAGGRYDDLVKDFGGIDTGAVGYALGMERIIIALGKKEISVKKVLYLATLGDKAKVEGFRIAGKIRSAIPHLTVMTDIKEASLKSQLRFADKSGAKFVLILGDNEISKGIVILRDMSSQKQIEVSIEGVIEELRKYVPKDEGRRTRDGKD